MQQLSAVRAGPGSHVGAMQLHDCSGISIGVGQVHHGGAGVCQVEVHQVTNGKTLAAPVDVVQRCLPGTSHQDVTSEGYSASSLPRVCCRGVSVSKSDSVSKSKECE